VYIEGRLRTREYAGADGVRRYSTEVVAETVKLLQARRPGADEVGTEIDQTATPLAEAV